MNVPRTVSVLALVSAALVGCGGSHGSPSNSGDGFAALGASSIDLTIGGGNSEATSMKGAGATHGSLTISTQNDSLAQRTTAAVDAFLPSPYVNGRRLMQTLEIDLADPATIVAGTSFALGSGENTLEYDEAPQFTVDPGSGNVGGLEWKATSGTATVVSRSGSAIVLSLSGVTLTSPNVASGLPLTLSGTIKATVTLGMDM